MSTIKRTKEPLSVTHPNLCKEWDYDKNAPLIPDDVSFASNKKVWWKCNKGHEWMAVIENRTAGNGCPYCSGRYAVKGENDLASLMPDLAKEWDFDKNGALVPDEVTIACSKKVWWRCSEGHSWQSLVSNRTRKKSGCPYCAGLKPIVGKTDLSTTNPDLLLEWDYVKNEPLTPKDVSAGSEKKVWWICSEGHSWQAVISNRAKGHGCPYCSGLLVISGINDLLTVNPELAKEWHPTKNGDIKPENVLPSTSKKAWWLCNKGHEWQAAIGSRTAGNGCPFCSGKIAIVGETDLATTNPELLFEWDFERNTQLTPKELLPCSEKKVWWKCSAGHSWQAQIKHRTQGENCPYCSNRKVLVGYNDLATMKPYLAEEWDYIKNAPLLPSQVTCGSDKSVWWKCWRGHEWKAKVSNRNNGNNCPFCSGAGSSMPEQGIRFYLSKYCEAVSRARINGDEIDVFLPAFNIGIEYDGFYYHKGREAFDMAKSDRLSESDIKLLRVIESDSNEVRGLNVHYKEDGMGPNYEWALKELFGLLDRLIDDLSLTSIDVDIKRDYLYIREQFRLYEAENNIVSKYPYLINEWDYEKNGNLSPEMFNAFSSVSVWWKCSLGHSWQALISNRTGKNKTGCPYCSGKYVLVGFNDLATKMPDLAKEWNYEKNTPLLPSQVTCGANRRVWWKCSKGHEWSAIINHRVRRGSGCPYCSGRYAISGENDLATKFPLIAEEWNYDRNIIMPSEVKPYSHKKVWWRCSKGHEWQSTISNRTGGQGCFECGKRKSNEAKNKPVMCIENGIIYQSLTEAENMTGISRQGICNCCKDKRLTAGGYHWEYVE